MSLIDRSQWNRSKKTFFPQCAWALWGCDLEGAWKKRPSRSGNPQRRKLHNLIPSWGQINKSDAGDRILDMENELGKFIHDYLA